MSKQPNLTYSNNGYMLRKFLLFSLTLALLISLFLEITLFNYTHYATLFTNKHFGIVYNEQEQNFISNANEYLLKGISVQDSFLLPTQFSSFEFKNLNTKIASIYIEPIFLQENTQSVRITWADEESSARFIDVSIIKDLNFSNYINVNPHGKVSNLTIAFLENNIAIKKIVLNKEIPMAIMPIRLIIVFGILFFLICLKNAETREKISWFCFDYLYDKTNFRQRAGFATLICFMLIFNFLISYSVYGFKDNELAAEWLKIYSHQMTDAFLKKQLYLDIKVPKALLEAERPYDYVYRTQKGLITHWNMGSLNSIDTMENALLGDHAYYKGKYYSSMGMLPLIVLFAPYKLVTGDYLPSSVGALLFGSLTTVLLMLLWKQIVQNYLKTLTYFFFLISSAALYACSFIPVILSISPFHIIAQYSALAFVILGIITLLQAKENLSIKLLAISSLSFALAVACRPSALFWSILIPVLLWDKRKELINTSKYLHLLVIIIPFTVVGSILALYNYARFDSPFEFGYAYIISGSNQFMFYKRSIIGKIYSFIETFSFMLFNPPNLDLTFPFVTAKISNIPLAKSTYTHNFIPTVGILCLPLIWFLFYVRKVDILRNFIFAGIFVSLLNIALLSSAYGITYRYLMDFSWIMAIGALICAFQLQEKEIAMKKVILKAFYSCSGITLLFVFFLTISIRIYSIDNNGNILNPKIHHYLARTFGVICNVP
ncbi:MAG: hypothetical protein LBC87_02590 [Fibromonadaceae bacterium]|jgi:hypothetical protein|nr:hypothetical protein [Fibromonadaceae bacterium]